MSLVTGKLTAMLEKHPAAPFLFIGSGFSRRYLGLEDWTGLLSKFCKKIRHFGYYSAKADGNLPLTASYIAEDFNEWWWSADETEDSRKDFADLAKKKSDAIKYEISKYLDGKTIEDTATSPWAAEISSLVKINVDGIITTNWDHLLEDLFPEYKVFVGQDELLFANPQSIGEIYKIHGSANRPHSLVLTSDDYAQFSRKNPYLAAKLVTIFVEHPIVFLGYSINDPHIKSIIMSIAECLTQEKISEFEENLFFVQRLAEGEQEAIEKTTIQSQSLSISMTVIKTDDFSSVYSALSIAKRKMPVRLLRFFKEQLYELTRAPAGADKKLAVVNYEEIDNADEVEFVVGLGVAKRIEEFGEKVEQRVQEALEHKGYVGVSPQEVFADCLEVDSRFIAKDLLEAAYPGYSRSNRTFIPVYRYLRAAGVNSKEELKASKFEGAKKIVQKLANADYILPSYSRRYKESFIGLTSAQIIANSSSTTEALIMLPFQDFSKFDAATAIQFLRDNAGEFVTAPYDTAYRKLICLCDKKLYGF